MTEVRKELGIVGLGRMGGNLALQALEKDMRVVGYTRHAAEEEFLNAGLVELDDPAEFCSSLTPPRAIFLYVPAGAVVDTVLDELSQHLQSGDVLIDGGNSYWGDSIRRYRRFHKQGIHFVDLGTSGGVTGARHGACFMAGGEEEAIARIEPMLKDLAVPGGYVHAGPPGAGHFVKLVHNGIEFGILQAIGEGMALLESYHRDRDKIDIPNTLNCWRHGSVIRSWLVDLMHEAYINEGGMDKIEAYVEDTGEVNWLVDDALHLEVPIPAISQSVMQLLLSRDNQQNWARAIAMMRHGFGAHPYGADESTARERQTGRVGGFLPQDDPA